jgi:hypothetical protein
MFSPQKTDDSVWAIIRRNIPVPVIFIVLAICVQFIWGSSLFWIGTIATAVLAVLNILVSIIHYFESGKNKDSSIKK